MNRKVGLADFLVNFNKFDRLSQKPFSKVNFLLLFAKVAAIEKSIWQMFCKVLIGCICLPSVYTSHEPRYNHVTMLHSMLHSMKHVRKPSPPPSRGGRLTSLDASFMRCFGFFQTLSKTLRSMFFQNIAETSHR